MADKTQSQHEDEIQKKLKENPMFDTLCSYLMNGVPGGKIVYVSLTDDVSIFTGTMRYGKARLFFDIYVENNGAINTIVFDLREIYDRIVAKADNQDHKEGSDCEQYVYQVLKKAGFDNHYVCLFESYNDLLSQDKDEYSTFGISLINYEDDNFNKFTPWASVLYKVLEAIDAVNGYSGSQKLNKLKKDDVDRAACKMPPIFLAVMIGGYVLMIGAILLIALNKAWPGAVNWILGIILIIAGLICGPNFTWFAIRNKKEYNTNSGDLLNNFHKPVKKIFLTIKD